MEINMWNVLWKTICLNRPMVLEMLWSNCHCGVIYQRKFLHPMFQTICPKTPTPTHTHIYIYCFMCVYMIHMIHDAYDIFYVQKQTNQISCWRRCGMCELSTQKSGRSQPFGLNLAPSALDRRLGNVIRYVILFSAITQVGQTFGALCFSARCLGWTNQKICFFSVFFWGLAWCQAWRPTLYTAQSPFSSWTGHRLNLAVPDLRPGSADQCWTYLSKHVNHKFFII